MRQASFDPHHAGMKNAIETAGLTKRYGEQTSVDHLDLCIPSGKVTGFVGPNGAGKTTTIRMLLGLITPSAGEGTVLGQPITHPERYLSSVGAMIEGPAFIPNLSGRANLQVLARLGEIDHRRVAETLEIVDLASKADEQYRRYSLGMKQRLGIAASLLPNPQLVMLDEPTNGLDPEGIRDMRALLVNLAATGSTVFVSSHMLSELEHISDHLVMIERGRTRYQGSLGNLLNAQSPRASATPEDRTDVPRLAALLRAHGFTVTEHVATVTIASAPDSLADLNRIAWAQGIVLSALSPIVSTLEEIFFANTTTPAFSSSTSSNGAL